MVILGGLRNSSSSSSKTQLTGIFQLGLRNKTNQNQKIALMQNNLFFLIVWNSEYNHHSSLNTFLLARPGSLRPAKTQTWMSGSGDMKPKNSESAIQLVNLLKSRLNFQILAANPDNLSIGIKLNIDNYQIWATLIRKAVGGRGRSQHLTGVPPPPPATDPEYSQWKTNDQCDSHGSYRILNPIWWTMCRNIRLQRPCGMA